MSLQIDCDAPAPYITGSSWRPSSCTGIPTLILAIEMIVEYLCTEVAPSVDNNNFRVVGSGTPYTSFNAAFSGGTPAQFSLVSEGNNLWYTSTLGATWDLIQVDSFAVGNS